MSVVTENSQVIASPVVANGLKKLVADSYLLMIKSHNYHWNVQGLSFFPLHEAFQEHYEDLFSAIDDIAERLRALDHYAPGGPAKFQELSDISEETEIPESKIMVERLINDHEITIKTIRETREAAAEVKDEVTVDLMNQRESFHSKTVWMLRSHNA